MEKSLRFFKTTVQYTNNKFVSRRGGEDETGEEEGREMAVNIETLPGEQRELTDTHTRTHVPRPQLLVATDTRHLELHTERRKSEEHSFIEALWYFIWAT